MKRIYLLAVVTLLGCSTKSEVKISDSQLDSLKTIIITQVMDSLNVYPDTDIIRHPVLIGKTVQDVKEYWELLIPDDSFDTGVIENTGETFFCISNGNWCSFIATFDKTSKKCITHSEQIRINETSVMAARFRKAGLIFDQKTRKWVDNKGNVKWSFGNEGNGYYLICEAF